MIPRETVFAALFYLLQTSTKFVTTSRRLKHWADVPAIQQPALFVAQRDEDRLVVTNQPYRIKLSADVYVYTNSGEQQGILPSTQMNDILDAIDAALLQSIGYENQTLGGLVSYCRISGKTQTDEGALGDQSVAIIPIEILLNN